MERLEVNTQTGERTYIQLTDEEVNAAKLRTKAEEIARQNEPEPISIDKLIKVLIAKGVVKINDFQ